MTQNSRKRWLPVIPMPGRRLKHEAPVVDLTGLLRNQLWSQGCEVFGRSFCYYSPAGICAEEKLLQAGSFCIKPGSAFPVATRHQMPKGVEDGIDTRRIQ